jgi:transcriptional regulator with XRE-family HTH domain
MPVIQPTVLHPAAFTRFGDLLRFLRRRAQLTQRDLGIAVGYNFAQICRLEQGQRLPDRSMVAAVFVPALGLEQAPELAARLIELADAAHQQRHDAELATLIPAPAQDTVESVEVDALEAIPAPAPYEVPRLRLVARLHARLIAERRVALVGLAAAEQGYVVREAVGDRQGMLMAANQRALLLIALDRLAEAGALAAHTLALGELTGDMYELGFTLEKQAIVQMLAGDAPAAQSTLRQALALPTVADDPKLRDDLLDDMAVALLMNGAVDEVQAILEAHVEGSGLWVELDKLLLAALIALARGEHSAAHIAADQLASRARAVGYPLYERKARQLATTAMPPDYPRLMWVIDPR